MAHDLYTGDPYNPAVRSAYTQSVGNLAMLNAQITKLEKSGKYNNEGLDKMRMLMAMQMMAAVSQPPPSSQQQPASKKAAPAQQAAQDSQSAYPAASQGDSSGAPPAVDISKSVQENLIFSESAPRNAAPLDSPPEAPPSDSVGAKDQFVRLDIQAAVSAPPVVAAATEAPVAADKNNAVFKLDPAPSTTEAPHRGLASLDGATYAAAAPGAQAQTGPTSLSDLTPEQKLKLEKALVIAANRKQNSASAGGAGSSVSSGNNELADMLKNDERRFPRVQGGESALAPEEASVSFLGLTFPKSAPKLDAVASDLSDMLHGDLDHLSVKMSDPEQRDSVLFSAFASSSLLAGCFGLLRRRRRARSFIEPALKKSA